MRRGYGWIGKLDWLLKDWDRASLERIEDGGDKYSGRPSMTLALQEDKQEETYDEYLR